MASLDTHFSDTEPKRAGLMSLSLAAIGVVYGDIGTSPLYAFREAMLAAGASHGGVQREDVLGVLSLIVWALVLVVTLKYVIILLHADNEGEGGTLSLLALAQRAMGKPNRAILTLGLIGAALFYGDAAITPAISVLSAIEGLKLVTHGVDPFIEPIAIVIIIGLFLVQNRGTEAVARFFGPITLVWFLVMAAGGVHWMLQAPEVLASLNPIHAFRFVVDNGKLGLIVLGAVFLAVTGAEALYADMGHFGRKPIQLAWLFVAFPALLLTYFGQGALVLSNPAAMANPFYLLFPNWALLPVVILATMATIIASQAVITGAFSLTQQAVQLRMLPRMKIRHTSDEHQGQIYLPAVNRWLMFGVLTLVVVFGSSSSLASAYGISVTGTMVVTATLAMIVAHKHWKLPLWLSVAMMLPLLLLDVVFLGANLMKVAEGGYVPLGIAAIMLIIMASWIRGSSIVQIKDREAELPLDVLLGQIEKSESIATVSGTAVFLTSTPDLAPAALLHSLKHFKALHEQNVILTITTHDVPRMPSSERVQIDEINGRFRRIELRYGYAEEPDVPRALLQCRRQGWKFDIMATSFILSRRRIRLSTRSRVPSWQGRLFITLARNAAGASDYFRIPAGRVVEIGTQMNI
ncbi:MULTISPECIES: potassium transporter Kup [Paracoccus]|uniref:Probable potassium transport system protein Kup n=1 Tax=Paracoccus litorisediminis TaxID=2006130 RepID=A0A844HY26_9RHOB|nr:MULTISPECIES: potassium transporter Kup [Paracoccus]MBD9529163.1 potassium transporter Kup [Paracoccus sp. PAR01]MTH62381.1 potassium transporter Kup [Paracoccus litorisediminis]